MTSQVGIYRTFFIDDVVTIEQSTDKLAKHDKTFSSNFVIKKTFPTYSPVNHSSSFCFFVVVAAAEVVVVKKRFFWFPPGAVNTTALSRPEDTNRPKVYHVTWQGASRNRRNSINWQIEPQRYM